MMSLKGMTVPLSAGVHPQILERWVRERGHTVTKGTWGQEIDQPIHYPTQYGLTKMLRTWQRAKPEHVEPLLAMMALLPDVHSAPWSRMPEARETSHHNLMATLDVFNMLPKKILTYNDGGLKTPSHDRLFLDWPKSGHQLAIVYEYGDLENGVQEGVIIRTLTYNVAMRRLSHADNREE